jgi:hypothetical protein
LSNHHIQLLEGAGAAVFPEEDTGADDLPLELILAVFQGKGGIGGRELQGPHARVFQTLQSILIVRTSRPDEEIAENGVAFIDPVVPIFIILGELAKGVSRARAEKKEIPIRSSYRERCPGFISALYFGLNLLDMLPLFFV